MAQSKGEASSQAKDLRIGKLPVAEVPGHECLHPAVWGLTGNFSLSLGISLALNPPWKKTKK